MTEERPAEVSAYARTLERVEPDIAMIDADTAAASISISLKRIADNLSTLIDSVDDLTKAVKNRGSNGGGTG